MVRSHSLVVQWTLNPRGRGFKSHPNHLAPGRAFIKAPSFVKSGGFKL